jgi:hypothetical protein
VVVLKTDKSGKMCLVTTEEYKKMGLEHTNKDQEIDGRSEKWRNSLMDMCSSGPRSEGVGRPTTTETG